MAKIISKAEFNIFEIFQPGNNEEIMRSCK